MAKNKQLFFLTLSILTITSQCNEIRFLASTTTSKTPTNLQNMAYCIGSDDRCMKEFSKLDDIDPSTFNPFDLNPSDYPCLLGCVSKNEELSLILQELMKVAQQQPTQADQLMCAASMTTLVTPAQLQELMTGGQDAISPQFYQILIKHEKDICPLLQPAYQRLEEFFGNGNTNGIVLKLSLVGLILALFI